ncbi:unnamed protein product [Trichogramma brassicae]|uniref:Uncharacterized protein n=1 Tax=Trichogramma brassicae TaxID=86971 RepID=A0A6H5IMN8_9HYME|nr:unnamed protein product [Trichogramma brassicae]
MNKSYDKYERCVGEKAPICGLCGRHTDTPGDYVFGPLYMSNCPVMTSRDHHVIERSKSRDHHVIKRSRSKGHVITSRDHHVIEMSKSRDHHVIERSRSKGHVMTSRDHHVIERSKSRDDHAMITSSKGQGQKVKRSRDVITWRRYYLII